MQKWSYSEFLDAVEQQRILKVTFSPDCRRLVASTVDGGRFRLDAIPKDNALFDNLFSNNVDVIILEKFKEETAAAVLSSTILFSLHSLILVLNAMILLWQDFGLRGTLGQSGDPAQTGRTDNARCVAFDDVMGVDGAKEEMQEVVDFVKVAFLTHFAQAISPGGTSFSQYNSSCITPGGLLYSTVFVSVRYVCAWVCLTCS